MNERVDLLKKSRGHWENMRTWVRTQPAGDEANVYRMMCAIGESWGSESCPLCQKFAKSRNGLIDCTDCPLDETGNNCNKKISAWRKVQKSKNWGEWLTASDGMIKVIDEAIEREEAA